MAAYYVKLYFLTLIAFFAIDLVWLGLVARTFYRRYLGFLMAPKVNWPAALIFYLLFVVGLLVFAIRPGLAAGSPTTTLVRAALFGLIAYATYDLTNLATLKDWPLLVTIVDLVWGTVVSVAVSCVGYLVGKWLG
jgi:uncharacterized membrane protein